MTIKDLFHRGLEHCEAWCALNAIDMPIVEAVWSGAADFGVCAYYRSRVIYIWPNQCARPGMAGRAWSYPGYTVDRTPYGVLAHELAHHVDHAHGAGGGTYGRKWRDATEAKPISGYCDNDNEWFAEMFRVYVTNPDLLRVLRPEVHRLMAEYWNPVELRPWREVLAGAPRQIAVAEKRIPQPKGGLLR